MTMEKIKVVADFDWLENEGLPLGKWRELRR